MYICIYVCIDIGQEIFMRHAFIYRRVRLLKVASVWRATFFKYISMCENIDIYICISMSAYVYTHLVGINLFALHPITHAPLQVADA